MADLFTTLRKGIAAGFKGRLSKGELYRANADVIDMNNGDVQSSGDTVYPFEGFVEEYSEFFRATTGTPDTDVSILILGGLIQTEPNTDDRVLMTSGPFAGQAFQLRRAVPDPAKSSWKCPAMRIKSIDGG